MSSNIKSISMTTKLVTRRFEPEPFLLKNLARHFKITSGDQDILVSESIFLMTIT